MSIRRYVRFLVAVFALGLVLCAGAPANAADVAEGTGAVLQPGDDIQAAIDAAAVGATLTLGAGTYTITEPLRISKGLTLEGQGKESTIISGGGPILGSGCAIFVQCLGLHADDNVVIRNLQINSEYRGIIHTGPPFGRPGGYAAVSPAEWIEGGNLEVNDCKIVVGDYQEGIFSLFVGQVDLVIKDCEITTGTGTPNMRGYDGIDAGLGNFRRIEVTGNTVTCYGFGGGNPNAIELIEIYDYPSLTSNCECDISQNTFTSQGWSIVGVNLSHSVNMVGNHLTTSKGGIAWASSYEHGGTIEDNTIMLVPGETEPVSGGIWIGFPFPYLGIHDTYSAQGMVIKNNKIIGEGRHGLFMRDYAGLHNESHDNLFFKNDLTEFTPITSNALYNPFCTPANVGAEFSSPVLLVDSDKGDQAMDFDGLPGVGTDVLVEHNPSLEFSSNQITVATWVHPDDVLAWRTVLSKFPPEDLGAYGDLYFVIWDGAVHFRLVGLTDDINQWIPTTIDAGVWTHLAITYDGNSMKCYKNGVKVDEYAYAGASFDGLHAHSEPLYVGSNTWWPEETFDGLIDEVHLFDRALNDTEIGTLYNNAGAIGDELIYFKFHNDDFYQTGTLQYVTDHSNHGNDGTVNLQVCPDPWQPQYLAGHYIMTESGTQDNIFKNNKFGTAPVIDPNSQLGEVHAAVRCEGSQNIFVGNNLAHTGGALTYFLGGNAVENQARGYSGGRVVDEPAFNNLILGYDLSLGYVYPCCVGSAGYNDNVAQPNAYEWVDYFGYWMDTYGDTFGPGAFRLPAQPIIDGKKNFITGFERMLGAGGLQIGPKLAATEEDKKKLEITANKGN